jgi:hypothetical protein
MQTAVSDNPEQVFEGMVQSGAFSNEIVSRVAKAEIYFGKGVVRDSAAEVILGSQNVDLPATSGEAAALEGIAIADTSKEKTADDYTSYAAKESVPVMRRGRIWVVSADVVDDLSKGVYVRFQNGGASYEGSLGSFRATTDTDYQVWTGARWIAGFTKDSVEYGLLELNLP